MAGWRQAVELAMAGEEIEALTALSRSRTEPAGRVSRAQMLLGYRGEAVVFCRGTKTWRPSSDGAALRRAGAGLWRAGGPRRPTATGQRADDHAGSEGLVGIFGLRQGQGRKTAWDECNREIQVWTNAYIFQADTEAEARAFYYECCVFKKGDWEGVENPVSVMGLDSRSIPAPVLQH